MEDLQLVLMFDDKGRAFLFMKDGKGRPVGLPDYRHYSGAMRILLKELERVDRQRALQMQWDDDPAAYSLADNDHLVWTLAQCEAIYSVEGKRIHTRKGTGKLVLEISDSQPSKATLVLEHEGHRYADPKPLSETFFLVKDAIFQVAPVGRNFAELTWFQTKIAPQELETYLSLACTYFDKLEIRLPGYRWLEGGEKKAGNALLIQKVDEVGDLFLKVSVTVPGLPVDLLDSFDLEKVALVNAVEKTLTVYQLTSEDREENLRMLVRLLNKAKKSLKENADFFQDENGFIIDRALASVFLERELTHLMKHFTLYGAKELKAYQIRVAVPKLKLDLHHGLDFLEGEARLEFEEESVDLFEALKQFRNHGYVALSDGTRGLLDRDYIARLERLIHKKKKKAQVSFFDLPMIEELLQEPLTDPPVQKLRKFFKGMEKLSPNHLSLPALNGTLRPYQAHGFQWLGYLHQYRMGGCLADDMGLGKTLQTIALLAHLYPDQEKPTLVVMPRSLLFNWQRELQKFAPRLTYALYYGPQRDWQLCSEASIILTTYATARNDIQTLQHTQFHCMVLDESQNIKNLHAQTTKAMLLLKADFRLALSGTPFENHLGELYSLFRFLNPTMFGTFEQFKRSYGNPIQRDQDKAAMEELRRKIFPFILRRLKKDVATDLPEKVEQVLYVDMEENHQTYYEQRRKFYQSAIRGEVELNGIAQSQIFILQALSELRQIAAMPELKTDEDITSPKRELLMEQVSEVVANGHKILVYANFLGILSHLSEDLESQGIGHVVLTGASHNRAALVDRFQNDPTCKVFLLSLKAGGVGLNLTAAEYVYIFDPWWNRAAENQALDRAHRIGQKQTVFCYRLITRQTIEEKILQLQELKAAMFNNLIGDDGKGMKNLSEEDLEFIFGNT